MILSLQLNREALGSSNEPHYMQDYNRDRPYSFWIKTVQLVICLLIVLPIPKSGHEVVILWSYIM
jgi:hypothetical protein